MVTPPASPEPGEIGGIVMARLRARGPPGESDDPVGMELVMDWIQELISTLKQKNILLIPIIQHAVSKRLFVLNCLF